MIQIPHDFLAFLKCLSEHRVKHLLIDPDYSAAGESVS